MPVLGASTREALQGPPRALPPQWVLVLVAETVIPYWEAPRLALIHPSSAAYNMADFTVHIFSSTQVI